MDSDYPNDCCIGLAKRDHHHDFRCWKSRDNLLDKLIVSALEIRGRKTAVIDADVNDYEVGLVRLPPGVGIGVG